MVIIRAFIVVFACFWVVFNLAFIATRIEARNKNIGWILNDVAICFLTQFILFYLGFWVVTGNLLL